MSALDTLVVVIVLGSAILSLFRGLTREALSIAAWIAAVGLTWYGHEWLDPLVAPFIGDGKSSATSQAFSGLIMFLLLLLFLSYAAVKIAQQVKSSALGPIDRSLGVLFGIMRGWLICALVFLVANRLAPKAVEEALANNQTLPLVSYGADILLAWLPEEKAKLFTAEDKAAQPAPSNNNPDSETAYPETQRQDMNRLLDVQENNKDQTP